MRVDCGNINSSRRTAASCQSEQARQSGTLVRRGVVHPKPREPHCGYEGSVLWRTKLGVLSCVWYTTFGINVSVYVLRVYSPGMDRGFDRRYLQSPQGSVRQGYGEW